MLIVIFYEMMQLVQRYKLKKMQPMVVYLMTTLLEKHKTHVFKAIIMRKTPNTFEVVYYYK